ncbi:hypothetical protein DFAR_3290005 [Desulfarculales bacterium]
MSSPAYSKSRVRACPGGQPARVRQGVAGLQKLDDSGKAAVLIFDHHPPRLQPRPQDISSRALAMGAPALPASMVMMRLKRERSYASPRPRADARAIQAQSLATAW